MDETVSLRERKKRATRDTIARAARGLFVERGFDDVTVVEVAEAAGVSEKTVFNYFAAKEDLAFAGGEGPVGRLLDALAQRPEGVSVLEVFHAATDEMLDSVASAAINDELLEVTRIVRGSRVLPERLAMKWERESLALTEVIAKTTGAGPDDVLPAIVARSLWWTHRTIFRAAIDGLLAGQDPQVLTARLRPAAVHAYDRLATGLGSYGSVSL